MKIPQLRILATSFCGRECIYCRPTGEGCLGSVSKKFVDFENALRICRLYKQFGGKEVKITGGDPIFWSDIVPFVQSLKKDIGIEKIEVITRSPRISYVVHSLIAAGMDVLNFSLDSVEGETYRKITGSSDYDALISSIKFCASKVPVKINSVIMRGINDTKVKSLIDFCESIGINQLKLLDIIDDLHDTREGNNKRLREIGIMRLGDLYVSLDSICREIESLAISKTVVQQGGLGHPMDEYRLPSGLVVTVKNSEKGAWYGEICTICPLYPCHDALMALRLTTDNKLQFCLLNEEAMLPLNGLSETEIESVFKRALTVYQNATFRV